MTCTKCERMFQFQTGAIKSWLMRVSRISAISFNSKLVRLKGDSLMDTIRLEMQFQFQTGAIKRELALDL